MEFKTIKLRDNSVINVKAELTLEEKQSIVDYVAKNSFINYKTPSDIYKEVNFKIAFVKAICPDFDFPMVKNEDDDFVIDPSKAIDKINELCVIGSYNEQIGNNTYDILERAAENRFDFECQKLIALYAQSSNTSDTIDIIASVCTNANNALSKICDILDNVKDASSQKGLVKLLSNKKVAEMIGSLQDLLVADKENGNAAKIVAFNPGE